MKQENKPNTSSGYDSLNMTKSNFGKYGWLMILMALSLISHLAITVNHFLSLSSSSCSISLPRSFISLMMSLHISRRA